MLDIENPAATNRTLRNIKKSLVHSLKNKYGIEDENVVHQILSIHGLEKDRFDFVSMIEKIIAENLNDASIDSNSNKNDKTVESIYQESTAPVKKAVGYDYLYRQMKDLYGKQEAKRLSGEMYDLSIGLSDSTNILKPYSYYSQTPIVLRINGQVKYMTMHKLFDYYKEFVQIHDDREEIDLTNVYKKMEYHDNIPMENKNGIVLKKYVKDKMSDTIKEYHNVEIWDCDQWVTLNRVLRHKPHCDMVVYQTNTGNFSFVTEDHPVILSDDTEILAKDLKLGMEVKEVPYYFHKESNIVVPTNFAYLLGFLIGDGEYPSYSIQQSSKNPLGNGISVKFDRGQNLIKISQNNVRKTKIFKVVQELFPEVNFYRYSNSSVNESTLCFTTYRLKALMYLYLGITTDNFSFYKALPTNVLSWDKRALAALISGLIDSDGYTFEYGTCNITMNSFSVISGLAEVCTKLGIIFHKNESMQKDGTWMFSISIHPNDDMLEFSEKVKMIPNVEMKIHRKHSDARVRNNRISKICQVPLSQGIKNISVMKHNVLEYVYDVTTESGTFYSNGMKQHNCWAVDASRIVTIGRPFGQLFSTPAKRVSSYISALCETVHQLSSHLAGAIAIGTFFLDIAHLSLYKEGFDLRELKTNKKFRKKLENEMQQFVHSVNHLSRNGIESPFTNISVFDRVKLKTLVEEMNWYFPYDQLPITFPELSEEELKVFCLNYVIDYITEIQNIFLNFFDKGDPLKGGAPYRFPIVTINLSKRTDGNKELVEDVDFLRKMCKRDIFRYNIFTSKGNKIASCCRLINNTEMLEFASQSNSFGAGGSVSLGSHRVCTIDTYRIVLESNTVDEFYSLFEKRIDDTAKILKAHKELLKNLTEKGLQSFIRMGWITLNRMFSTFGIIGISETVKAFNDKFGGLWDRTEEILRFLNSKIREMNEKYGIISNVEQIPGESFGVRFAEADAILFGQEKVPFVLYSNQFIPLWENATLWEKLEADGRYNKLITGGGIVHAQIGEKVTAKQAEKIIKYAVNCGCEHFALNAIYSECEDNHTTFGNHESCPICGKSIKERYTRVVGFFTPVSSWQKVRREWEFPRRTFVDLTAI